METLRSFAAVQTCAIFGCQKRLPRLPTSELMPTRINSSDAKRRRHERLSTKESSDPVGRAADSLNEWTMFPSRRRKPSSDVRRIIRNITRTSLRPDHLPEMDLCAAISALVQRRMGWIIYILSRASLPRGWDKNVRVKKIGDIHLYCILSQVGVNA